MAEQRLIDAEALYKKVLESPVTNIDGYGYINHIRVLEMINNEPTVEAKPVVHGRWISKNHHGYEWIFVCSNCDYIDGYPFNDRPNYCPNCGARMDEPIEENDK